MKRSIDVKKFQDDLRKFVKEREWGPFHTPKNLSMALAGEAGELLEIFQWLTAEQSVDIMGDPHERQKVLDEIADIFIYTIRLADILEIDVEQAVLAKMKKNASKYPVHLAKGTATKYTELLGD
jgi:NTP pyrophosphatase (non-canonical NTP hydrolase)